MKKKLVCIVVLCCTMFPVMVAEMKTYRDYSQGYKGVALAEFLPSKNGMAINSNGESLSLSELCDLFEAKLESNGTIFEKKGETYKRRKFPHLVCTG